MHTVSYTSFSQRKSLNSGASAPRKAREPKGSRAMVRLAWETRLSRSILCPPFSTRCICPSKPPLIRRIAPAALGARVRFATPVTRSVLACGCAPPAASVVPWHLARPVQTMRRGGSEEQVQQTDRQTKDEIMSTPSPHTSHTTDTAGVPPAPPEAHQRAAMKGDRRIVVVNGSRIHMEHDGHQWWNVRVEAV